jgi:predicted  nucleic acid-binding Zn-ribbon protein
MKAKKSYPYPTRAADVPVTQRMLYAVRDELKADIKSVRSEIKSVRSEIKSVNSDISSIRSDFKSLEAKVDSRFHEISSQIYQMKVLVEEQNAKNNIVLDGLVNLFERQERLEPR